MAQELEATVTHTLVKIGFQFAERIKRFFILNDMNKNLLHHIFAIFDIRKPIFGKHHQLHVIMFKQELHRRVVIT